MKGDSTVDAFVFTCEDGDFSVTTGRGVENGRNVSVTAQLT